MIKKKNSSYRRNADFNVCKRSNFWWGVLKSTLIFHSKGMFFLLQRIHLKIQTSSICRNCSSYVCIVLKTSSWSGRPWSLESVETPPNILQSVVTPLDLIRSCYLQYPGSLALFLVICLFARQDIVNSYRTNLEWPFNSLQIQTRQNAEEMCAHLQLQRNLHRQSHWYIQR